MPQLNLNQATPNALPSACSWCHQGAHANPEPRVQARTAQCPECHRTITLVTIDIARNALGVSRKTIYDWIEKGWARRVQLSSGKSLLCFSSLFAGSNTKNRHVS